MRHQGLLSAAVFGVLASASLLSAQLRVVATQPDLADVARRLGGELVTVESLTEGHEDLHLVRPRPSLLLKVRRADVFIQLGLDAEHAWVPALLSTARNRKIAPDQPGFINASLGIAAKRVPSSISRGDGPDIHPHGNPHFNLDPEGMRVIARNICRGFKGVMPDEGTGLDARLATFEKELDEKIKEWTIALAPVRDQKFFESHDAWVYFADRFGLTIAGRLEPNPGLAPTPGHLAKMIELGKTQKVRLIVCRPSDVAVAKKVAAEIGGKVIALPLSSATTGSDSSWFRFMDRVVAEFGKGLSPS